MIQIILVIAVLLFAADIFLMWLFFRQSQKKENDEKKDEGGYSLLLQQINEFTRTVDQRLGNVDKRIGETTREIGESARAQFSESQNLIKSINKQVTEQLINVAKEMTETNQTGKQVLTIADQLRDLEKVLKHQKQRGNLGEMALDLILSNVLPPSAYKLQYMFKDGDKVDAVILTKEGFIPVDAKFSLDNYNRIINESDETRRSEYENEFKKDLKKRIDETSKYIRPEEGTLPFAFMFIPAEGIYYDLLVNEVGTVKVNTRSLIDYAYNDKKVIIVSPTTFAAYLQSVLYGFRAFKIEETAKDIIRRVEDLGKHIAAYDQFMGALGNQLGKTVSSYNKAHKELQKIDKDVLKITGKTSADANVEALAIEKPAVEEV